jgi:hypothetical protein
MAAKLIRLPTAQRWFRIFAIALAVAFGFRYVGPTISAKVEALITTFFGSSVIGPALLGTTGTILLILVHRLARAELRHIRQGFHFPPLPIAIVIGLVSAPLLPQVDGGTLSTLPLLTSLQVLASVLVYLFAWGVYTGWKGIAEELSSELKRKETSICSEKPDERLKAWLKREEPVDRRELDLLGYSAIADRALDRLQREESTIALQGEFGSGKSSVCKIAESEAKRRKLNLIFVYASCWGFEDASRTQKEVLDAIIREVGKEVDCLEIRELPEAYIDALSTHATFVKTLVQVGQRKLTPLEQLQRLSPILAAIDKKVVVIIEDVDRAGNRFDLAQIQALLMQFREVERLSFILAISPMQQVDFVKLCDHIEIMPTLERSQILEIIHKVREMLLSEQPPGILLDRLQPLVAADGDYRIFDVLRRYSLPWQLALCTLLNKPRLLKHALRRLCDSWPRLRGEVKLDDLVSIVTLRVAAPQVFQFLCDRFALFAPAMERDRDGNQSEKNPVQEKLATEWRELCATGRFDAESAAVILKEVYPQTASATGLSTSHSVVLQSMQSKRRGEVYARRLLTEYLEPAGIRDQTLLGLMQRAGAADAKALRELAEVITGSRFASAAFEDFADAVDFNEEVGLLSEVYAVIRRRFGALLDLEQCPGFFAPWRRLLHKRPSGFEEWLVGELIKCVPEHLWLLTNIYYYWLGTDKHSRAEREQPRKAILAALKKSWKTSSPQTVASGFNPAFPYVLFHLIFTSDYQQPEEVPLGRIDDWIWSGPILMNAAKQSPTTMLPQIVVVLNKDEGRYGPDIRFNLDQDRLQKWFKKDASELLDLIANGFDIHPEMSESNKYLIKLAVENVRSELAKCSSSDTRRSE